MRAASEAVAGHREHIPDRPPLPCYGHGYWTAAHPMEGGFRRPTPVQLNAPRLLPPHTIDWGLRFPGWTRHVAAWSWRVWRLRSTQAAYPNRPQSRPIHRTMRRSHAVSPSASRGLRGPPEGVLLGRGGRKAGRLQARGRLLQTHPGDAGAHLRATPQARVSHRINRCTAGRVPQGGVVWPGVIDDLAQAARGPRRGFGKGLEWAEPSLPLVRRFLGTSRAPHVPSRAEGDAERRIYYSFV